MAWPQDAYVGQKVVCINVNNSKPFRHLHVNDIYTIAEIIPFGEQFRLIEIPGQCKDGGDDWSMGYHRSRFRPIQSTSHGMEILRGLLNTKLADELVEG